MGKIMLLIGMGVWNIIKYCHSCSKNINELDKLIKCRKKGRPK